MALFTSSFERSTKVLVVASLLALSLAGINTLRPDPDYVRKLTVKNFWQNKVFEPKPHSYDIVAEGDSRVYRGFSPEAAAASIPGASVFNDGFSSGGHNPQIFARTETLLSDDPTRKRAVVMGISPMSLSTKSQLNEAYADYLRKGPLSPLAGAQEFFRPLTVKRLKRIANPKPPKAVNEIEEFRTDGWVRSDWVKHNSSSELKNYDGRFNGNQVDPAAVSAVLDQVRDWTARGITVIGYRPPTTPEMVALENAQSGFDEPAFVRDFTAAGGKWVDVGTDYTSYDGSHLTPESTEKLTKRLMTPLQ